MKEKTETKEQRRAKLRLLWRFLKGSKRFFAASILAALVTALADTVNPQIIRTAVDCIVGNPETDLPAMMHTIVERLGGFARRK